MAEKLFKNELPKVPVQDARWTNADSLGDKIEKVFTRFIQRVTLWGFEFFAELMVQIFDASMKILQPGIKRMFTPYVDKFYNDPAMPKEAREMWERVKSETGESGIIGAILAIVPTVYGLIAGVFAAFGDRERHAAEMFIQSQLPNYTELAQWHRAGLIPENVYVQFMAQNGLRAEVKPIYEEWSRNLPQVGEDMEFLRRGLITQDDFIARMKRMLYTEEDARKYIEIATHIPPVQDLIRFMVRDTFKPDVVAKYGYGEEYPDAINEFLKKQGYTAEWGEHYWKAHWNLPSPNQVFEMLQRGIIDRDTMLEYLKVNDYPKFWRDALAKISYNLYTRVDVRRLLQAGMLNEDEAFKAYKEMGYDEEKARKLTDFAVKGISQDEKDLTKTDILNLYEEGLLDRSTVAANLVKMGYDQSEAEDILKLADVNIAKAARTDAINYVHERFTARLTDEQGARNELAQAGLKAQSVDRYLMAWMRVKETDVTVPSKADVKGWYMNDYITEEQAREYLKRLKYAQVEIDLYMRDYNDQKASSTNAQ